MKRISAKSRINIGLVALLASVMLGAVALGLFPDRESAVREGRAKLAESIAFTGSARLARNDVESLESSLRDIVDRNDELISAGVRTRDDQLLIDINEHESSWSAAGSRSDDAHIHVPLYRGEEKWGSVELQFSRPAASAFWAQMRYLGFVAAGCGLLFAVYLWKMLQHLDPSKAVPTRVRDAFNTFAEGLLVLDTKGRIMLTNATIAELVGVPSEKLLGRAAGSLEWEQMHEEIEQLPWERALQSGQMISNVPIRLKAHDGSRRTFNANCSPIAGHDGKHRGVLIGLDDVTLLETQRAELAESKQAAEAANLAKSDFLANMSHEIRTPMNAILGFTELMRRGMVSSENERVEYLNTIHESGHHLLRLINDLLDLSKVEAGRMSLERTWFSPHVLLGQTVKVLDVKARESRTSLAFAWVGPAPRKVFNDEGRLRQVLTNLVGNAIKFTKSGGVTLGARLDHALPQAKLVVEISDTGIGMNEEQLARIFDPFSQADASITRRFGGTGLGLTISRRFAEAMGGDIVANSEEGRGSTFTVTIEAGPPSQIELVDPHELSTASDESVPVAEVQTEDLAGTRVLIVEDGEQNRQLISLLLRRVGMTVETAANGLEALVAVDIGDFDVVFMDMQMPVMDGYTATRRLRAQGLELPIVALTGNAMREDEQKCLEAGCTAFLPKPVNFDKLFDCLREVLGHREAAANAEPTPCELSFAPSSSQEPSGFTEAAKLNGNVHCGDRVTVQSNRLDAAAGQCERGGTSVSLEQSTRASAEPLAEQTSEEHNVDTDEFARRVTQAIQALACAILDEDLHSARETATALLGCARNAGRDDFGLQANAMLQDIEDGSLDSLESRVTELTAMLGTAAAGNQPALASHEPPVQEPEIPPAAEPAPANAAQPPARRIESTLPMDDHEFRQIVVGFTKKLSTELSRMRQTLDAGDFDALAGLAHWLKGAGGTVGFADFTEPAVQLEQAAKARQPALVEPVLSNIAELADAIWIPGESEQFALTC